MKTMLCLLSSLCLLTAVTAAEKPSNPGPAPALEPRAERREEFSRILKELNLTEDQKQAMKKIRSEAEKEKIRLKGEIQTIEIDIRDEITNLAADEAKVVKMTEKIGELRTKMEVAKAHTLFKVRAVLNKEQQQKAITNLWGFGFFGHEPGDGDRKDQEEGKDHGPRPDKD
jgi:Spy/CpxP family protein refolding chaperone